MDSNEQAKIILHHLFTTWNEITKRLMKNPENILKSQCHYWQDYTLLCQNLTLNPEFAPSNMFDSRFKHEDWQKNLSFNFIKNSYLLLLQHVENFIHELAHDDEKMAQKLRFFSRQFLDAIAPNNFVNTNPEVLTKIFETNGSNLLQGLRQFLEDMEGSEGQFKIKMTDLDSFKVGENIACTAGKVVYQNELMQLLQYTPATKQVHAVPLLIIPPWINKYYILDLQQENSLVKWLVDQGFTVFMISWVNADSQNRTAEFADYMTQGALQALKVISNITGSEQSNVVGYCIGGTLLGCSLAYLAEKKLTPIKSATFLTTLFDFSEPGELGAFIDDEQISMLEKFMEPKGYMDGSIMASVFNALRANDLIWASFINNYLKGQKPRAFDLLYWNTDASNIPEKVHSFYLRNMYLENQLALGKVQLQDIAIDLGSVKLPSYFLAAQDDHIVPWKSSFQSKNLLGTAPRFVLTSSGHVAGVVNPPLKNKYGYWTATKKFKDAEGFLENATFHEGSWWNDWAKWLKKYSGEKIEAGKVNKKKTKPIENAPGSYVRVKLVDIIMREKETV